MEEIKFVENPKVNKKVVKIVETLKEGIISNFHPKSIILSGSFGKGEVTVIEDSGDLRFLSDCEVIIIPYRYIFNRSKVDEFELNFYERTGLKVGIWGATLGFYLLIPFMNKKMKPTMDNYDLKYGSKVIYGKNYLDKLPDFKPEEIPLWEGIRLLFNRMVESLEHFSFEKPTEEMVFWTDKIVLACQDVLLLSIGRYDSSYKIRSTLLQKLFPLYFNELNKELPNFLPLALKATRHKLNPEKDNYKESITERWFDAAEMCDKVFRYVIKKDMGITFDTYLEFHEKYLKHPKIGNEYYNELLSSPIYRNMMTLPGSYRFLSLNVIKWCRIPWKHIIYSVIPILYFSLSRNGNIHKSQLKQARNTLSVFKKINQPNENVSEEWKYLKNQTFELWYHTCY